MTDPTRFKRRRTESTVRGFSILLAFGVEIAVAMGVVAALSLVFFVGQPMDYFARAAFEIMNNFTFTAIPLFVFMGAVFSNTGIINSLFRGTEKIFGAKLP